VVTDHLPAGTSYDSATPSQGTCSEADGTVICELGAVSNGAGATVEIKVKPQTTGTFTNTASVAAAGTSYDIDTANNTDSEETEVKPVADLSVTKSDSPDPVLVGQTLTYSIALQNDGPSDATGVTLTDELPSGVAYDSAIPSQGSCSESGGTVTCALGEIANGNGATVELNVRPQQEGTISNTARVSAETIDPNGANDADAEDTTVDPTADLSITKTDSPDPATAGQQLTYNLTVRNNGPSAATGVTATDTLPAGVSYRLAVPSQGSCLEVSLGSVSCTLGSIASGESATVQIDVIALEGGVLTNRAAVRGNEPDLDPSNDLATEDTTVTPVADVSISISDSPDPVKVGQTLTYTILVRNNGPSTATGVRVSDTLPSTFAFQSATASQGGCTRSGQLVTCDLGSVASGGTATVQIKVTPKHQGDITNRASVTAVPSDPNVANNAASTGTKVRKK